MKRRTLTTGQRNGTKALIVSSLVMGILFYWFLFSYFLQSAPTIDSSQSSLDDMTQDHSVTNGRIVIKRRSPRKEREERKEQEKEVQERKREQSEKKEEKKQKILKTGGDVWPPLVDFSLRKIDRTEEEREKKCDPELCFQQCDPLCDQLPKKTSECTQV